VSTVVTVGTFDGVHRGHWAVLEEIARRARASARESVLVTFDPHPLEIVNPAAAPPLLTTLEEKRVILAASSVDRTEVLAFTEELRGYEPERFVREILLARFGMAELVIGYDHGFGFGRAGGVELLRRLGAAEGFAVDVVPAVHLQDGRTISSTLIRRAVAGGNLATATEALGRPYAVSGVVEPGAGRGRTIGIPTANIAAPGARKLLPPDGVYAAIVTTPAGDRGAMVNLGSRPTFGEAARALEAHLFEFGGDLYGRTISVAFIARLRETRKFGGPDELRAQLERDRAAALAALSNRA
jgi:riboflavin kinase/FMN adenylyltransferase